MRTRKSAADSATPKAPQTRRAAAAKAKQAKINETSSLCESKVEEGKTSGDSEQVTPEAKVTTGTRRTPGRPKSRTPAKGASKQTLKSGESVKPKVEGSEMKELVDACDVESPKVKELVGHDAAGSLDKEQAAQEVEEQPVENIEIPVNENLSNLENVVVSVKENVTVLEHVKVSVTENLTNLENTGESAVAETAFDNVGEDAKKEQSTMEMDMPDISNAEDPLNKEEHVHAEVSNSVENDILSSAAQKGEEAKDESEETKNVDDKEEPKVELSHVTEETSVKLYELDLEAKKDIDNDDGVEDYADRVDLEGHGEEESIEEDPDEPVEEDDGLGDESSELTAHAKERKIKKEHEIFVGGLDRDALEKDVRNVFEKIGEIIEVRVHKNLSNNKNKGYAFVKFANKEHAKRALSEMKNPLICGKRCGTAPSEDNGTLFMGNICNTWTTEAIKQKLKDYGIDGVENITLVPDVQHEGLSRGFAFIEFPCHAEAMLAYKRLQKPDAVFGHPERSVKVAFAEPLREPDPEVMAQVKSVFVDGLPPHWNEDHVREQFKSYGDIVRIVLARNMSTAKRKDFGFIDFSTHEAAVACIDGINNTELGDGSSKTKVRARLSNPLPKTQAVKGGMCGGFRIGRGGGTTFFRGRGFVRGAHTFNRSEYQRGRGFYPGGRGPAGRISFPDEYDFNNPHVQFHGRQTFGRGGRRGFLRGGHHVPGRDAVAPPVPFRPNPDRPWYGAPDRDHGIHFPHRTQPYSPEGHYGRPFMGRHSGDAYLYDDGPQGMKRPFYMTDHDRDYNEPSRLRPRLDYPDPPVSFSGTGYNDNYGPSNSFYTRDYYRHDYDAGTYPSYHRGHRPFGGGY